MIHAIITGDIIDSTHLNEAERKKMLAILKKVFADLEEDSNNHDFKIYRGDSFQGVCNAPEEALLVSLKIKTALLRTGFTESNKALDARLAIGIGTAGKVSKNIGLSDGEAFRNSGQLLNPKTKEEFKKLKDYKLLFKSPWEDVNAEVEVLLSAMDALMGKWTIEQAEVIYELLNRKTQTQIAAELSKSQSSISERVQNANWLAISNILARYETIVKQHTLKEA
ncbi:MAG: SatD family protein [Bacteroidota bacterium]